MVPEVAPVIAPDRSSVVTPEMALEEILIPLIVLVVAAVIEPALISIPLIVLVVAAVIEPALISIPLMVPVVAAVILPTRVRLPL